METILSCYRILGRASQNYFGGILYEKTLLLVARQSANQNQIRHLLRARNQTIHFFYLFLIYENTLARPNHSKILLGLACHQKACRM